MRRYLSLKRTGSSQMSEKAPNPFDTARSTTSSSMPEEDADQAASTTALVSGPTSLPPANLKVKRVDYYFSKWSKTWKYKDMGEKVVAETLPAGSPAGNDPWQSFCFVVVRTFPRNRQGEEEPEPTFHIVVKSPYLLQACKDVIRKIPGLSWNAEPLQACRIVKTQA